MEAEDICETVLRHLVCFATELPDRTLVTCSRVCRSWRRTLLRLASPFILRWNCAQLKGQTEEVFPRTILEARAIVEGPHDGFPRRWQASCQWLCDDIFLLFGGGRYMWIKDAFGSSREELFASNDLRTVTVCRREDSLGGGKIGCSVSILEIQEKDEGGTPKPVQCFAACVEMLRCLNFGPTLVCTHGGWFNESTQGTHSLSKDESGRWTWCRVRFPVGTTIPPRRYGAASCVYEHSVLMWGGRDGAGGNGDVVHYFDDLWRLDLSSATHGEWRRIDVSGHRPSACYGAKLCVIERKQSSRSHWKALLFGGAVWTLGGQLERPPSGHVYVLHMTACTEGFWELVETLGQPGIPRMQHAMVEVNGVVMIFGGYSGNKSITEVCALNTNRLEPNRGPMSWLKLENGWPWDESEFVPRAGAAVCASEDGRRVVIFGGANYLGGDYFNDAYAMQMGDTSE